MKIETYCKTHQLLVWYIAAVLTIETVIVAFK